MIDEASKVSIFTGIDKEIEGEKSTRWQVEPGIIASLRIERKVSAYSARILSNVNSTRKIFLGKEAVTDGRINPTNGEGRNG